MTSSKALNIFDSAIFALIILACVVKSGESFALHKIVETNNGKIRGILKTTLIKNIDYYSFKGIPYAKSPTGRLRFKVSNSYIFIDYLTR